LLFLKGIKMTLGFNTRQVAKMLNVRANLLQRRIWEGTMPEPIRTPAGHFIWSETDVEAAQSLLKKEGYFMQGSKRNETQNKKQR
jgi:hypothetical protein